jgi:hypothetical protein
MDVFDDLEEIEMKRFSKFVRVYTTLTIACLLMAVAAGAQNRTDAEQDARLIPVFNANEAWNGVTTTADDRVFVDFPHLDGSTGMRVAELSHDGTAQPYPDADWNRWQEGADAAHTFVRVNALRIGPDQQLWVVDTGAPGFGGNVVPGGVKIVVINPQTNRVSRIYPLDSVTSATSYIDDIRFHGPQAYITDAGIPGLIVLDLESGNARRVLDHHHSTTDERLMLASGQVMRTADGQEVRVHADQLEVSPDGTYLYFQPCSGPLYPIETRFLDDPSIPPAELACHVERWVDTPTTGGTAIDAQGNIYVRDVNKRIILKIIPASEVTTLIQDSRLDWADAMWIDPQGYLWIPAAQLDQIAPFQGGVSRVNFPVSLYTLQIGAQPEY